MRTLRVFASIALRRIAERTILIVAGSLAVGLMACTIQPADDTARSGAKRPAGHAAAAKAKKPNPPDRTAGAATPTAESDPLIRRASQGNAAAQYRLATELAAGDGRPHDPAAAVEWFTAAAAQDHAGAQFHLGAMLSQGVGGETDLKTANQWYRRAAVQGHAGAQYNLGVAHATGAPRDYAAARKWFEKAAAQGMAKAHYNLAQFYEHGADVAADPVKAYAHYELAAEGGEPAAADRMDALRRTMTSGEIAAAETALATESTEPTEPTGPTESPGEEARSSGPLTAPALLGRRRDTSEDAFDIDWPESAMGSIGYGVQLGAFRQQETADRLWRQLLAKHGDLLDGQRQRVVPLNHVHSEARLFALRTGPFAGRDSAGKLCRQLQDRKVACIVVSL